MLKHIVHTDIYYKQRQQMEQSEVKKLEQAAHVHGYRGPSKKRHNGVVSIRPHDKQLWKSLRQYTKQFHPPETFKFFADVKVVAHVSSGNRLVGKIYKDTETNELTLYIFGCANYNYNYK